MKIRLLASILALLISPLLAVAVAPQEEKPLGDVAREARKKKEEAKKDSSAKTGDKKVVTTDEMRSAEAAPPPRKRVFTDENIEGVGEGDTPMERYTDLDNGFSIRLPAQWRAAPADPHEVGGRGFEFAGDAGGGMIVTGFYVRVHDLDTKGAATSELREIVREVVRQKVGGAIVSEQDTSIRGMAALITTMEGPAGPNQRRGMVAGLVNEDHRAFVFACRGLRSAFQRVEALCRSVLESIRLQ